MKSLSRVKFLLSLSPRLLTLPPHSLGFLGKFYFFRVTKYLFRLSALPEWSHFFQLLTDSFQGLMLTRGVQSLPGVH